MANQVFGDRVQETFTTTGTGTISLAGAVAGYQPFSGVLTDGQTCYYGATDGTNWEIGIGTYATAGNTITRTTILSSSNAGSAVNWAAGTKSIWIDLPAAAINKPPTIQILLSGSGTYTTPARATYIRVRMIGSGTGGSGSGTSAGAGVTGVATTFGSVSTGVPGAGATGADWYVLGGVGQPGDGGVANAYGGDGGGTALGGSTPSPNPGPVAGKNGRANTGAGASGASCGATVQSGAGGDGGTYCEKTIVGPAATYAYTVAAAQNGGTAGTNGAAGGISASGLIIVEEHYGA